LDGVGGPGFVPLDAALRRGKILKPALFGGRL